MKRVTYYGFIGAPKGRGFLEVECVREGDPGAMRLVSQRETGRKFRTQAEAWDVIEAENKAAQARGWTPREVAA